MSAIAAATATTIIQPGDEVVYFPQGKTVSLSRLDIGRVQSVSLCNNYSNPLRSNHAPLLVATVDFEDWVDKSEKISSGNGSCYRLHVPTDQLQRLDYFLENNNTIVAANNEQKRVEGGSLSLTGWQNGYLPLLDYVRRPCLLEKKTPITHHTISEEQTLMISQSGRVIKGKVKRLFETDGDIYVGVEFECTVYVNQLPHCPFCPNSTNGCESRVAINLKKVTKEVWDKEFLLLSMQNTIIRLEEIRRTRVSLPPSFLATIQAPKLPMPTKNMQLSPPIPSPQYPSAPPYNVLYEEVRPMSPAYRHQFPNSKEDLSKGNDSNLSNEITPVSSANNTATASVPKSNGKSDRSAPGLLHELKKKLSMKMPGSKNVEAREEKPQLYPNLTMLKPNNGPKPLNTAEQPAKNQGNHTTQPAKSDYKPGNTVNNKTLKPNPPPKPNLRQRSQQKSNSLVSEETEMKIVTAAPPQVPEVSPVNNNSNLLKPAKLKCKNNEGEASISDANAPQSFLHSKFSALAQHKDAINNNANNLNCETKKLQDKRESFNFNKNIPTVETRTTEEYTDNSNAEPVLTAPRYMNHDELELEELNEPPPLPPKPSKFVSNGGKPTTLSVTSKSTVTAVGENGRSNVGLEGTNGFGPGTNHFNGNDNYDEDEDSDEWE